MVPTNHNTSRVTKRIINKQDVFLIQYQEFLFNTIMNFHDVLDFFEEVYQKITWKKFTYFEAYNRNSQYKNGFPLLRVLYFSLFHLPPCALGVVIYPSNLFTASINTLNWQRLGHTYCRALYFSESFRQILFQSPGSSGETKKNRFNLLEACNVDDSIQTSYKDFNLSVSQSTFRVTAFGCM